jgi:hypothetical protein
MKLISRFLLLPLLSTLCVCGQGSFVYDQQSADESGILEGGGAIQSNQPLGQSFVPTVPSVGFVRLYLYDGIFGNGLGATLFLNLRATSISGTILGSTVPVSLNDRFAGTVDFLFPSPIAVTPGTAYCFQPVVQSGDNWGISAATYNYSGGTAFSQGSALPSTDLWFREGIIVPEPGSAALILLGSGIFWRQLWRKKQQNPCDVVS